MDKKEYESKLVKEVYEDFKSRQMLRRNYEAVWQLNINFLMGKQNCIINGGEVGEEEKRYAWEE